MKYNDYQVKKTFNAREQLDLGFKAYRKAWFHGTNTTFVLGSTLLDSVWLEAVWRGKGLQDSSTALTTVQRMS